MKKIKFVFMLSLILSALCLTSCSERIDAGSEGILVNLYGSDKGVDDVSLVTGRVWYNPFTEEVYEYPTFVQTIDYPAFTINAKDGSEFTVDPTVSLKMVDGNAPRVFKKYRKELKDIVNGTLFNYVKDAFRIQLNKYTTDQIVSNRDLVERAIEAQLSKALAREHFHLEQLTSGLKYPSSIVEAVNQKNKAIQEAQRALNEVAVKKAEAEKMEDTRSKITTLLEHNQRVDATLQAMAEENTLQCYCLLAALRGLEEQGCDGPVKDGINRLEKHLNKRAHEVVA